MTPVVTLIMPPRSLIPGEPASRRRAGDFLLPLLCTLALAATSCVFRPTRRAAASSGESATATAAVETRVGVIRAMGADQGFVLIETPSALATASLSEGQLLHCRPPDAVSRTATADLRVSRERHQALIVANVVAGEAAVGAVVYAASDATPAASPSPDSISSVSTAPLPGLFAPRKP